MAFFMLFLTRTTQTPEITGSLFRTICNGRNTATKNRIEAQRSGFDSERKNNTIGRPDAAPRRLVTLWCCFDAGPSVHNGPIAPVKPNRRTPVSPPIWKGRRTQRMCSFRGKPCSSRVTRASLCSYGNRGNGTKLSSSDVVHLVSEKQAYVFRKGSVLTKFLNSTKTIFRSTESCVILPLDSPDYPERRRTAAEQERTGER